MDTLGKGIYTIPEACRYLGAHQAKIYRWFKDNNIFHSDYNTIAGQRAISFLDLIDAKIALMFRDEDVPMAEVRKAYQALTKETNRRHPFAYEDLYFNGGKIFRRELRPGETPFLYRVATKEGYFDQVMQPFLRQLDFNEENQQAERWRIAQDIILDPNHRAGAPIIVQTNIPAETIAQCYRAYNGDVAAVADLYDLNESQVRNAVTFCQSIGLAA